MSIQQRLPLLARFARIPKLTLRHLAAQWLPDWFAEKTLDAAIHTLWRLLL